MNTKLNDLSILRTSIRNRINSYSGKDFVISDDFKVAFQQALPNGDKIKFNMYTAEFITKNGLKVFVPNQYFYLASIANILHSELINYKNTVRDNLDDKSYKLITKKEYSNEKKNAFDILKNNLVVKGYNDIEIEYLDKFLNDYKYWGGGKTIDRTDFTTSSILNCLNLVNNTSTWIIYITEIINSNGNLLILSEKLLDTVESTKKTLHKDHKGYNKIYFGSPGTGKSFKVNEILKDFSSENIFRTTIHPDYSYYNFVGHVMPTSDNNGINYKFVPGIFTMALKKAMHTDEAVFLILEELSRGNVSSIFGDIFQLLDRNPITFESQYTITNMNIYNEINNSISTNTTYSIKIPDNLYIIGTVNINDQNVFVLDSAFKRRFEFEYVDNSPVKINSSEYINDFIFSIERNEYKWNAFYTAINKFIIKNLNLNEDKLIGPFFIIGEIQSNNQNKFDILKNNNEKIKNKLIQYLWEDVHKVSIFQNADTSLFKKEINSFGELYTLFTLGKNVFSQEVINLINDQQLLFDNNIINNENEGLDSNNDEI